MLRCLVNMSPTKTKAAATDGSTCQSEEPPPTSTYTPVPLAPFWLISIFF